jgi:TPR repeat protein
VLNLFLFFLLSLFIEKKINYIWHTKICLLMDGFRFLKSETLRRAIVLRTEGRLPEAVEMLDLACEEGNDEGQSLFVKGDALCCGGFFLKKDCGESNRCLELSAKAGCSWAMAQVETFYSDALASKDPYARGCCYRWGNGVETNYVMARELCLEAANKEGNIFAMRELAWLGSLGEKLLWAETGALAGDAKSQWRLGNCYLYGWGVEKDENKAFDWWLKGAQQRNWDCCQSVANCYENGTGCKKDLAKCAFYNLEGRCEWNIRNRLEATEFDDEFERLRELFLYGRGLKQDDKLRNRVGEFQQNCIRVFEESVLGTQQAVFCFILICKKKNWLSKDTRRVIGEMIWESRCDPFLWMVDCDGQKASAGNCV